MKECPVKVLKVIRKTPTILQIRYEHTDNVHETTNALKEYLDNKTGTDIKFSNLCRICDSCDAKMNLNDNTGQRQCGRCFTHYDLCAECSCVQNVDLYSDKICVLE